MISVFSLNIRRYTWIWNYIGGGVGSYFEDKLSKSLFIKIKTGKTDFKIIGNSA